MRLRFDEIRAFSSVGRASPLQGEGQWFKSTNAHHYSSLIFAFGSSNQCSRKGTKVRLLHYLMLLAFKELEEL